MATLFQSLWLFVLLFQGPVFVAQLRAKRAAIAVRLKELAVVYLTKHGVSSEVLNGPRKVDATHDEDDL